MRSRSALENLIIIENYAADAFRVKRSFVDACDNLVQGILLGQIVYWHLPSASGKSKLRVFKDGRYWLAKGRNDWYDEIRISPKQFDTAIKKLVEKGFVETKKFRFNGVPTVHIHLNEEKVLDVIYKSQSVEINTVPGSEDEYGHDVEISISPKGKKPISNDEEIPTSPKGKKPVSSDEEIPTSTKGKNPFRPMGKIINREYNKDYKDLKKEKSPKRKKRVYELDSLEMKMALKLESLIKENDEKFKAPNLQTWCNHFRLMMERDNRTEEEIYTAMTFAQSSEFWQSNILSAEKLRNHMTRLLMQNKQKKSATGAKNNFAAMKETAMTNVPKWLDDEAEKQRAYDKQRTEELSSNVPDDEEIHRLFKEFQGQS